jgi:hypothetical protein
MGRAEDLFERLETQRVPYIDELILARKAEELFLDFKRSANDGNGPRLHDHDRNNLAKAISGFGNAEGGVVVWGVDCSRNPQEGDVARARVPIINVARFVGFLEGAVSGCTIPPHSMMRSIAIPVPGSQDGFVATLIPKSAASPHQVVGKGLYYIRAGSDFVPIPHGVLANMFGRAPRPEVIVNYSVSRARIVGDRIEFSVGVHLVNAGPIVASDLFATVIAEESPGDGEPSTIAYNVPDRANWEGAIAFNVQIALITRPGYRIPPNARVQPLVLDFSLTPPFGEGIVISGICGASGGVPAMFRLEATMAEIDVAYRALIAVRDDAAALDQACQSFATNLLRRSHS